MQRVFFPGVLGSGDTEAPSRGSITVLRWMRVNVLCGDVEAASWGSSDLCSKDERKCTPSDTPRAWISFVRFLNCSIHFSTMSYSHQHF